ncbi:MAG: hypothetical protein ABIR46_02615 [Candidatus Saccharimonadales bacterium]
MEKEIISSVVASLPESKLGEIPKDHEIWEETDGGAELKVTRHILLTPDRYEFLSLSVSGEPSERQRVVREFVEVFGEPFDKVLHPDLLDYVEVVSWIDKIS